MRNCNVGWEYLNCLALIFESKESLLLPIGSEFVFSRQVPERRKEGKDLEETKM